MAAVCVSGIVLGQPERGEESFASALCWLARCGDAATLHICHVSWGTLVTEKDSPRLHCDAAMSHSLLSRHGTGVAVSYSLLSRHGTAVVVQPCPTDCMQLPLRLG